MITALKHRLIVLVVVGSVGAFVAPVHAGLVTLQDLANGATIQSGDLSFSQFKITGLGNPQIDPTHVLVSTNGDGLVFSGDQFSVDFPTEHDVSFSFHVSSVVGAMVGATLAMTGGANGGASMITLDLSPVQPSVSLILQR
jgi:hypothetical protein